MVDHLFGAAVSATKERGYAGVRQTAAAGVGVCLFCSNKIDDCNDGRRERKDKKRSVGMRGLQVALTPAACRPLTSTSPGSPLAEPTAESKR